MEWAGLGHGRGFIHHQRAGFFPEFVVSGPHFLGNFGMLIDDVRPLAGVFQHVEERVLGRDTLFPLAFGNAYCRAASDKAVTLVADSVVFPLKFVGLSTGLPAGFVSEEIAVIGQRFLFTSK